MNSAGRERVKMQQEGVACADAIAQTCSSAGQEANNQTEEQLQKSLVAARRALDDCTFRMRAVTAENEVLKVERGILESRLRDIGGVGQERISASSENRRQERRCRELERDLEGKIVHLDRERAALPREREAELSRIRADMLRLREEEQRELTGQRREVEEQRMQLQIARDSFGDAMAEAKLSREECVELKAEIQRQQLQLETIR